MRLVFMGTPDFAVPALDALAGAGHDVVCAFTQPPRPAGRGKRDRQSPVHTRAEALGIAVRHPESLRAHAEIDALAALGAEAAVVVAYGLILPQAALDTQPAGCLNIHASLLPRWRGAAPIHRAVMAGDAATGVCIMRMEVGLDTGPVLAHATETIGPEDTTGDLHDRLAKLGADLAVATLGQLDALAAIPQTRAGVTYAEKIDKAEARIDWSRTAEEVDRHIRGLSPFPGAWCEIAGERVKLLRSRVAGRNQSGPPGTLLPGFGIACGEGAVAITELQRAGRRRVAAAEALRGWSLPDRID